MNICVPRQPKSPASILSGLLLCLLSSAGQTAQSQVRIEFMPPPVEANNLCTERASDKEILARWAAWNGKDLPQTKAWVILREAQRLRDLDAKRNFDLVTRIVDRLAALGQISSTEAAVEKIELHRQAGNTQELQRSGLIDQLLADVNSLSPRQLKLAADLVSAGLVNDREPSEGQALMVRSASGGNADALLELAGRRLSGEQIYGWDVDPSLTITMALGAMVGKLDERICDRMHRIAREFEKGEVVVADRRISEAWLRAAADLGDASAAWKVAKYHLESTAIDKDNATLVHYLKLAADRGVVPAMTELAKSYEAGAIVDKDPDLALSYFAKAAEAGSRSSLTHLADLYQADIDNPVSAGLYERTLHAIAELEEPPGWVFSGLGSMALAKKGRWLGEDGARGYFERGAKVGDVSAISNLAQFHFRHAERTGRFSEGINLLRSLIEIHGITGTTRDIRDAFLCRRPGGPDIAEASKWSAMVDASDEASWPLSRIEDLLRRPNPVQIAALQSEALYGRPDALAAYFYFLEKRKVDATTLRQWSDRVAAEPRAALAHAKMLLSRATDGEARARALELYMKAAEIGSVSTKVSAAEAVIANMSDNLPLRELAIGYLEGAAKEANGKALMALARLQGTRETYERYKDKIVANGDAEALMFAAEREDVDARKHALLSQAAAITPCTFDNAVAFAQAYRGLDDAASGNWMTIAEQLTEGRGWRYRKLAEMAQQGQNTLLTADALRFYQEAVRLGDVKAEVRLMQYFADPSKPSHSSTKAAEVAVLGIENAPPDQLPGRVARINKLAEPLRSMVMSRIDLHGIFRKAARQGDPAAMREYAKLQLAETREPSARGEAQALLLEAANAGDVPAMLILARNNAFGIGGAASLDEAKGWLRKASGLGSREATEMLASMQEGTN